MLSRLRGLFVRGNGQHGETRVKKKKAGPRSHWKKWRNKWSWGKCRTTREAPSQLSTFITEPEQLLKHIEKLGIQLHDMTQERNELREILANYNKDLNNRLNFELEMPKIEHQQVMSDLQKLPMEISEAVDKCKHLMEETESVSFRHRQATLREWNQLKKSVRILRQQNRLLSKEQIELQESCEKMKRFLKEFHEMICGPSAEQQQEQESWFERLNDVLKLKEAVTLLGRNLAEKLQHHFSVTEMRSNDLQSECEQATAQNDTCLQTELLCSGRMLLNLIFLLVFGWIFLLWLFFIIFVRD